MADEELTVNEAVARLRMFWTGDYMDLEGERRAVIEVTDGSGDLFLPRGRQGDKGLDGEPGPAMAPAAVIAYATDAEAIASLPTGLGPLDKGYCVLNDTTNSAFFWSGTTWLTVTNAVGLQGPQGPPIGVSIGAVTTSPSGGSASVSLDPSSTATNKVFNFTLPRGAQGSVGVGSKGEPGDALASAGDVQWPTGGPADGQTMVWDDALGKMVFATFAPGPVGPYGAGPDQFAVINDNSWPDDYKQVCKITVPAQPFAWHPRVLGYCDVKVNGIMARVDLEARLNSPTGPLVGRGPGTTITGFLENYTTRTLIPCFEGPMTPETSAAMVAAGSAADIYLVIKRIDTLTTFGVQTRKDRASASVYCDPIPGSI
jgi:hypothetical protein